MPFALIAFVVGLALTIILGRYLHASAVFNKFVYPGITLVVMFLFFVICCQAEDLVAGAADDDGISDFIGIYILVGTALLLLCYNGVALFPTFNEYFERRLRSKPSAVGVFLTLGAGAIVFGFLDNFGMKLGTDALEGKVFMSLGKSIVAKKSAVSNQAGVDSISEIINANLENREGSEPFKPGEQTVVAEIPDLADRMSEHIDILDDWSGKDYAKIINCAIRLAQAARPDAFDKPKDAKSETVEKEMMDVLVNTILEQELEALELPASWTATSGIMDQGTQLGKDRSRIYLKDLRERYNTIKDASAMLGNTFSDFVGALLGAGVGKLFSYLTAIDGDAEVSPDDGGVNAIVIRFLQNGVVRVVMEAVFIAIGCLIPVWMHYKSRDSAVHKTGVMTFEFWVLGFVGVCILAAGFMTEPVPDEPKTHDELEEERKMEKWTWCEFWTGGASFLVFTIFAVFGMVMLNSLDS